MSKLSFYTASFPSNFNQLADYFENKSARINESISISRKRLQYIELKYSLNQVIIEEYYDTNNIKKSLERLSTKEVIFRIYNRTTFNFVIINQPRSISNLKNFLSKLFHFDFFLSKEDLNLLNLLDYWRDKIDYISKVEFRDGLYPNNIFSKNIFYTQNKDINSLEAYTSLLKTNHYSIYKIDLYFKQYFNIKFIVTKESNFSFIGLDEDDVINFIFDNLPI
ncbi:hypothetical protein [Acinetobacter pragensis]|uniref:Uncharacterized protein n=1 Tax=Acinetobacter pragensis TaxID=1806892 RepID=A0A151Y5G8_9GAMM|nr:hypothetical protein [Acinetobacter pragensis]KYQ73207.1 hypothetical protein AZH43_07205 [Acinetobacter pragensis]